ncbi:histocompatibility antigen 60b-like [Arvicanthis niloticus]|uniref:histocompatibility antigen 60b-like n=1 Tax=Arvicanthis niloticus TaxID=61156 RepID=UPI00402B94FB
MAKGATSKSNHSLNLSLLILMSYLGATLSDGTDSLSCNFTVMYRAPSGQCSVNGEPFLLCGDKRQDSPVCKFVKEINATEACILFPRSLEDIFYQMTNLESKRFETEGYNIQATMQCQYNQGELIDGRWTFIVDGQTFYFDLKTMTWGDNHSDPSRTMKHWKDNSSLGNDLRNLHMGQFRNCPWRDITRSTIKVPDTTQPTSATQIPSTGNSTQVTSSTQILLTGNTTQTTLKKTWNMLLVKVLIPSLIVLSLLAITWMVLSYILKKGKKRAGPSLFFFLVYYSGKDIGEGSQWSNPSHSIAVALCLLE